MEKVEIVYAEYVRLVERHDKILDSSFNDIKLYGVIGSAIALIGSLKKIGLDIDFLKQDQAYFVVILTLFFVIAIIAFRDLLKQVYISHLAYSIKTAEDHLKSNYFEGNELFILRETWQAKYFGIMQKAYSSFLLVFFTLLIALPVFLFNENLVYGIVISLVMIVTLIVYSALIKRIYS